MLRRRTLYDIFKLKVLLYFVVPIVLTAIIIFVNHRLNINQYYNLYSDFYNNYTEEMFLNMDKGINTIIQMDYWLKNDDVKKVFNSNGEVSDSEVVLAIGHMQKMKNDFNIIDSILLVNRRAGYVVATNGKTELDEYFSEVYMYKAYDAKYFRDIRYPEDTMIKLPPTAVEGPDGTVKYVMPIVKMAAQNENPNSFFVFNISLEKFLSTPIMSKYTDNTSFCFVNKKDKQFFSFGKNAISINSETWKKIDFDKDVQNYEDDNGKKYCVIARTVSPNMMDYAYVVFIPIKDVNEVVSGITLKIVVISILIYLVFAAVVLLLASNIGKVFGNLIKPLNSTEQVKLREVFKVTDKISKEFSNILNENSSMKLEIKNMEGDVKEKMITDVLNNKNRPIRISLYKYDSFLPIIFRVIPEKAMSEIVLCSIKEQLYSALHKCFGETYETFDITNLDDGAHFVLNVPHDLETAALKNEIKKLADIVLEQKIDVKFEYHIGEICDSFEKLKVEYMNLRDELNGKSNTEIKQLHNKNYMYKASEHNEIINSVLEGDYDKTIANIDRILISNVVNDVSADAVKILYQNIINTIITALRMKKLDVDKLIDNLGRDTYFNISELSETEITSFILALIKRTEECDDGNTEEKLMSGVMNYIDNNYSDYSLTLERVAEKFDLDAKSLSKQFKKYNQITFHKYLTELKIEESKRLLITTNMSVEQIYRKVGYISRTTFIRAFTSAEKITPSEYRKNIKG